MNERVMTSDEEHILYHRLRLASQAAAEPFIRYLIEIYSTELPSLIIYKDGTLECRYPSQRLIDETHRKCEEAMRMAVEREQGHIGYGI